MSKDIYLDYYVKMQKRANELYVDYNINIVIGNDFVLPLSGMSTKSEGSSEYRKIIEAREEIINSKDISDLIKNVRITDSLCEKYITVFNNNYSRSIKENKLNLSYADFITLSASTIIPIGSPGLIATDELIKYLLVLQSFIGIIIITFGLELFWKAAN